MLHTLGPILLFAGAAILSYGLTQVVIWVSRASQLGQSIREEGPESHQKKAGTPTFGGLAIFATTIILMLIFVDFELKLTTLAIMILYAFFSAIGLWDDAQKVLSGNNRGLSLFQKIVLQTIGALLFLVLLAAQVDPAVWIYFPIIIFCVFVIVGSSNAANLTDGLDGLWSGCAGIIFLATSLLCAKHGFPNIATVALILSGANFGFLLLNYYPAKIFMGDIGALGTGAVLAGIFIILDRVWWLVIIAVVPVIETLSVILQVGSFKLYGKRIFKMSPLHHHFELSGLSEQTIVWGAWLITLIAAIFTVVLA